MSFNLGFSDSHSGEEEGENNKGEAVKRRRTGSKARGEGEQHIDMLPALNMLRSQSMGLTLINSFSEGSNRQNFVPMSSINSMALRAFLSSSPATTGGRPDAIGIGDPEKEGGRGHHRWANTMGLPEMTGRYGPGGGVGSHGGAPSPMAPVVHASASPSYSHHAPHVHPRYDEDHRLLLLSEFGTPTAAGHNNQHGGGKNNEWDRRWTTWAALTNLWRRMTGWHPPGQRRLSRQRVDR